MYNVKLYNKRQLKILFQRYAIEYFFRSYDRGMHNIPKNDIHDNYMTHTSMRLECCLDDIQGGITMNKPSGKPMQKYYPQANSTHLLFIMDHEM